jgi:hypothetical protein
MMPNREKPNQFEKTQKYCPFLDKTCIHEDCEMYSTILGHCGLTLLPYNIFKLNHTIEKATKNITSRLY